jgi:sRNA-binding carbon storage regulator CsrA
MLCLERRPNESILIVVPASSEPRQIEVNVNWIKIGRVGLGITAPRETLILRAEHLGASPRLELEAVA